MRSVLGPYLLGPNPENQGVYTGDARELAKAIPDESIDLCFTDPVYQNIDDYRWLAETAERVLKPKGMLLTCCGIGYLPETIEALASLRYRWTLGAFQPNGPSRRGVAHGFSKWWACLWYDKEGASLPPGHFPDMVVSPGYQGWPGVHQWRKNPAPFISWLRAFATPEALIWDPYTGGGTVPAVCKMLGRRWLAFEIEPDVAERARERIRNTQPPLPGLVMPEQADMFNGG